MGSLGRAVEFPSDILQNGSWWPCRPEEGLEIGPCLEQYWEILSDLILVPSHAQVYPSQ